MSNTDLTYVENKEYKNVSRYQVLRVIDENGNRYLETYNQVRVPDDPTDIYHVVDKNEESRLDIISNNYYGSPLYWWAICLANDIIDPFSVSEGDLIRIPSLVSLSDYKNEILNRDRSYWESYNG